MNNRKSNLNKGTWKSMENAWVKAVDEGKKVKVKIEPVFGGQGMRPDRFVISYSINRGRPVTIDFKNAPRGV
ncbi:transposase [Pseudomonas frederiksbergensis]|jgi:filamentous hemagglutinin|uniref:Transposase n=1 Tax=Pseudomonas frederiksbergensis TaxID=104087 RepID=A0A423IKU2_9PSED|nr:transposase [Pseudomonas frederiksbergensis]